jgi:hypothetical protein
VLSGQSWFGQLFAKPSGGTYVNATFYAFFRDVNGQDQLVVEFTLAPPPAPAPVRPGGGPPPHGVQIPP